VKPHISIRFRDGVGLNPLPHWTEIIADKSRARDRIHPAVDRILDRYRVGTWAAREYQTAGAAWSPDELAAGLNRVYRLILQEDSEIPSSMIDEISLLPIVERVHPGAIVVGEIPPTSQSLGANTGQRARDAIGLDEAHRFTRGDTAITVAVLDTGVCLSHPELRGKLLPGYDFVNIIDGHNEFLGDFLDYDDSPDDEVGHGTHVAGIIAGQGIAMPEGVAPRCKVLPIRVLGAMKHGNERRGAGLEDNINSGLKLAIDRKVDVVNMSLGMQRVGGGLPHEDIVKYAQLKGVTIVAASGNDGQENLYYPGALPGVITVGAFDDAGEVAAFSTYGQQVSFVAPGTDVYSSYLDDDYAFSSGTSHAAPFVAGGVLLLKSYARSRGRRLSDKQVKHVLKHTADKVGRGFRHPKAGFGRLNLADALRLLEFRLR
jgi:subtilisin family serine protease